MSKAVGMVRVPANDPFWIGQSLDAGARGVIVPMVNSAAEAAEAVAACRYPPRGARSYGPMRAGLRIGPAPAEADERVACVVMAEAARVAGVAAGIHCPSGEAARRRLAEGFTFATVACDLIHLEQAAAAHLAAAAESE